MGTPKMISLTPEIHEKWLICLSAPLNEVDNIVRNFTVIGVVFLHGILVDHFRLFSLFGSHYTFSVIREIFGSGRLDQYPVGKPSNIIASFCILVVDPIRRISFGPLGLVKPLVGRVMLFVTAHVPLAKMAGVIAQVRQNLCRRNFFLVKARTCFTGESDVVETISYGVTACH